MAKKSTQTETEVQKITAEELSRLQALTEAQRNLVANLGHIEVAKFDMLNELAAVKNQMQQFTVELQGVYGEVNISIADGTISEIVEAAQ